MYGTVELTVSRVQAQQIAAFSLREAKRLDRKINAMYSQIAALSDTKFELFDLASLINVRTGESVNVPDTSYDPMN